MREDADDVGPAFDLLVEPLQRVGGAQPGAVGRRQREDRQPFGNGALEPTGQSRPAAGVLGTGQQEASAGLGLVGGVEDPAELGGDFLAAVLAGHVLHGVLHQVELAALPEGLRQAGGQGGLEAGVVVADDEVDAVQAAADQSEQEAAPMGFGLGATDREAQDALAPVFPYADGQEQGAGADTVGVADLLVAGVEDQVADAAQRSLTPAAQLLVEHGRGAGDLGAGDVQAADPLHDVLDLAGRDAADVHLGDGQAQGAFGAEPAFEDGVGVELDGGPADLRHVDDDAAQAGVEGAGLEAVGVTAALVGPLVGLGAQGLLALEAHGLVEDELHGLEHSVDALVGQELDGLLLRDRKSVV